VGRLEGKKLYITVIVSQKVTPAIGRIQPWVDGINDILKEKHQVKVLACREGGIEYHDNGIRMCFYKKMDIFKEDPISITMYLSLIRDKPNLVIIHALTHVTTLVATVIYGLKRIPIILFIHGIYGKRGLANKLRNFLIKLTVKKYVNNIVALTNFDKRMLMKEWGFIKQKVVVVPLGLSDKAFNEIDLWKRRVGKESDYFTYLFVGRLNRGKRVDMLIDAFNEVLNVTQQARLIIVGNGPEYARLISKVKNYEIVDHVKFVGWTPHEEIWKYYLLSDVVVLPSEHEGMPNVIYESLACGKPVIASNVCGINEVLKDGVNGLLFNSKKELTRNLLRVLDDHKLIEYMSENAAKTARCFTLSRTVQNLADVTGLDLS